jgi:hypothetical protein
MTIAARLAALAFAMAVAWAAPAAAQMPESKTFRDWTVACNELVRCFAETKNIAGAASDFLLRLARNRDEAKWNVILVTGVEAPKQPYEIYADLDGTTVEFKGAEAAGMFGEIIDLHLLGPEATALMAAMGPASEIGFEFIGDNGEAFAPRFSLSGLSASLLWIDEKQGRIGSPREAGDLPAGLEPAAVAAGGSELPEEVMITHNREGECEAPEDLPNGNEFITIPLTDTRTMYLVPCYAGAYNFAHAAYVMEESRVKRHWFADYDEFGGWQATDIIVNPDWEGGGLGRLAMFNRGRGIGDCGSTGLWQVSEGRLRMLKFTYKGDCDGEGEAGEFPVVYEAEKFE